MKLDIYTDGSCLLNKKNRPGGWAFIYVDKIPKFIVSGNEENTSNNRMELTAIITALEFLNGYVRRSKIDLRKVSVYSDSNYCVQGINTWINSWIRNGVFIKNVKNQDLWLKFYTLNNKLNRRISEDENFISYNWVKAHNGDPYNEQVDKICCEESNMLCQ